MKNQVRKLSIIIPTYNRKQYLLGALDALLPQVQLYRNEVSVLVCDNASTDGTQDALKPYIENYSDIIKYYRHEKNYGFLYNFKFGIDHAESEYVFLHGDDDLVTPYFLGYILSLLNMNEEVDLIHFNYFISSIDSKCFRMAYQIPNNQILINTYSDGFSFITEHYEKPSFISSVVFRKQVWEKGLLDGNSEGCYGYEWFYIMYKGCINSKCLFVRLPLSIQIMSNVEGYSAKWTLYSIEGMTRVFERLDTINSGVLEGWKKHRIKSKAKLFRNIASVYEDKRFYRKNYKEISQYVDGGYKVLLFLCVFILPVFIIKPILRIAKKMFLA